ncbi:HD domain-containing protein [Clostridium sp. 19966]|uniref:3'-5' exoribonuclease YhaM family protein n=1 Tax=Clostridium sp. 19966 TaxID=2768166 RepID=UPI0028DD6EDC|nr:3'-5' exoribonuclease YhaM family protein [Clostridium sp. 19966]MDT8716926.1 HD domain-containing protein [Clostridium sp. 19966]
MKNKEVYLCDIKNGSDVSIALMVMKVLFKDNDKIVCILADRSGDIKATIPTKAGDIKEGRVLKIEGTKGGTLEVRHYKFISEYELSDYLPAVKTPISEIMRALEASTNKYIISRECRSLNDYFFKDEEFIERFQKGIGGVSMHHNYLGGLAEHTLNVMELTAMLCEKYECRRTELAVLAAKLHDIGKIYEYSYDGPFKYSIRGEMEGHIVIGIEMVDKAIRENPRIYTDDFVHRIKGCIAQHHGKYEFGSPREMNMEESFILNYADSIDANMNKIAQIKDKTEPGNWSEYDRRIETKLYL